MTRFLALMSAAACLTLTSLVAQSPAHAAQVIAPGAFSYTAPPGWAVKTFPGMKYKICYAKPAAGFAPNVNVVDEASPVPLAEYARANLALLQSRYPGFHLLGRSSFVTRSGVHGVKLLAVATPAGRNVRQAFYLFAGRGTQKWVVTATTLAVDGNKYDRTLDASLRTFTLK